MCMPTDVLMLVYGCTYPTTLVLICTMGVSAPNCEVALSHLQHEKEGPNLASSLSNGHNNTDALNNRHIMGKPISFR